MQRLLEEEGILDEEEGKLADEVRRVSEPVSPTRRALSMDLFFAPYRSATFFLTGVVLLTLHSHLRHRRHLPCCCYVMVGRWTS